MPRIDFDTMFEIKKKRYPRSYETREDFLNHTFLVNGTGEHWYNGGVYGEETIGRRADRIADNRQYTKSNSQEAQQFIKDAKTNFQNNKRDVVQFVQSVGFPMIRIVDVMYHEFYHWYPICQYANLLNMPERGANPSFRNAAFEVAFKVWTTPTYREIGFHWRPKQTTNQEVAQWIYPNKHIVVAWLAKQIEQRPNLVRRFIFDYVTEKEQSNG